MNTPFARQSTPSVQAAAWLASLQESDGSLRGGSSIDDYYKAVIGLAVAGYQSESERMLNYVVRRFLKDDGDLDGAGCRWFDQFRIYPHAWLLMGAIARGRFDLVRIWADFLEQFQDRETGGFYGTLEQRRVAGEQEMMTTGVVAISLLWAGRIEAAVRTGGWFRKVLEAQPDVSRGLYFVWHHQRGLVREFPEELALQHWVDASKLAQWYFQFGIAAGLAAGLYGATGDRSWLDLGREYLGAIRHFREDVLRQGTSGKIGWGAAWFYRVTGDAEARRLATAVHTNLAGSQHTDGWWNVQNIYSRDWSTNPAPQISVTGEFAALLSWMENALLV